MKYASIVFALLLTVGFVSACSDSDVGAACQLPGQGALIQADSLDCESRFCARAAASNATARCTAECSGDSDCPGAIADCPGGFVCRTILAVGTFADQRFCVCANEAGN